MVRSITLFFLILLTYGKAFTQITYPIDIHDGQDIEACSGFFVDSGGDTLTAYGSNEDFSVTFTSSDDDKPYFSIEFLFFDLGPGDFLYVYDGENKDGPLLIEATGNELAGKTLWASTDSLHFHFISSPSDHGNGWWAEISCYSVCELFTVDVTTNLQTMRLCPGIGQVSLIAEAFYLSEHVSYNPNQITYEWFYDGQTDAGATLNFEFYESGAYPFRITAQDPANNCEAVVYETVQVGTVPSFSGTHPDINETCAEDAFSLFGVVNMITWTGFPTSVHDTLPIPDGTSDSYISSLTFDVFDAGISIEDEEDFGRVCLIIDHVNQGDLRFELECHNGTSIILKDYGGVTANLGEPVVYDNVTTGIGYEYCFTPIPYYGLLSETTPVYHEYTDQAGNYYFNAAYLPEGTYTSFESLGELTGCPLNGKWTITVTDNTPGENGYISGWSLLFNDSFYPDSLIFTPELVSETWYDNNNPLQGNPALVTKDEEGDYDFKFIITDSFNCTYDTTVTVSVLPLPNAEIESELELPFCEGDSTLLTVYPIDNNNHDWIYQWYRGNVELPERTYDTIMAKEPGMYSVAITDTITGCTGFVELEVMDENCDLVIPNVFTPNFDGINDFFEITNLDKYDRAHIIIYNRWGKTVFEHANYNDNWWDGNGVPDGVYYYTLSYERLGVTRRKHGVVHIVR